tara:strand:+ start:3963 stop:4232 length:270 start_codon:yes stop_codon:yes gene_type:complete
MGQPNSTQALFSEADREKILADIRKRDPKPVEGKPIQRIDKPYKYEPASIFTDTQQAEMNRIQNEQGGKELCRGDECEPNVLPVINPSE